MTALAERTDGSWTLPDPNVPVLHRLEAREWSGTSRRLTDDPLLAKCEFEISPNDVEDLCKVFNAVKKEGVEVWISQPKERSK